MERFILTASAKMYPKSSVLTPYTVTKLGHIYISDNRNTFNERKLLDHCVNEWILTGSTALILLFKWYDPFSMFKKKNYLEKPK